MLQQELRAQAKEAQDQDAVDVAATLRNLADRLSEYCGEGTYAHLLDRDTTVPADAPLVVFDTRRCPESGRNPSRPSSPRRIGLTTMAADQI